MKPLVSKSPRFGSHSAGRSAASPNFPHREKFGSEFVVARPETSFRDTMAAPTNYVLLQPGLRGCHSKKSVPGTNNRSARKALFAVFFFAILFSKPAFCAEKDEPIVCNGDKIEYLDDNKKLVGSGNMTLTYEDMTIKADRVEVNLQTKEAYATGNVVLTQGTNIFKAESILYNFGQKKGRLLQGNMDAPPWYGKCDQIDKVGDKEYMLGTGYISTCDRIPPHYRIRTRQVKLYLDDRIEAKNVVIAAGSVPIMYLPVYTHNVKNKKPMIAVVPGHSKEWGYYNLAAVRYDLHNQQQGKIHLDIRSEKGFASGITHNYNLNFLDGKNAGNAFDLGNGILDVYYMNEEDKTKPKDTQRERQRYRTMLRHKWQIDEKTLALAEYNKLTDAIFTRDYFYRQEYVNEIQPATYISLLHTEPGASVGFLYQNRINSFFTETEYAPQVTLDIKNQRLFNRFPLYYKGEYNAANLARKNANSDVDDDAGRLDGYNELSYAFRPFWQLSLNPYAGTRQSWYSKDKNGSEDKARGILYSGVDASTKFYKTYDLTTKFAGAEINNLRHIITPIVGYKYVDKPTLSRDNLGNFDAIDAITNKNILTFSVENDFQTKKINKEENKGTSDMYETLDLARFILSADYNFQKTPGGEFTNILADLELRPSGRFLIEQDFSFNPHSQKFDIANFDFVTKRDDGAKLGLGHRYQKGSSSEMTLDTFYPLTARLGLRCYERYQFYGRELKEQEYGVSYDLHCWVMDVNLNSGDGSTVWVIFRLKAFPDFPVQLGTTYERPKPETIGGSAG